MLPLETYRVRWFEHSNLPQRCAPCRRVGRDGDRPAQAGDEPRELFHMLNPISRARSMAVNGLGH